jgi:hypothetical protein
MPAGLRVLENGDTVVATGAAIIFTRQPLDSLAPTGF